MCYNKTTYGGAIMYSNEPAVLLNSSDCHHFYRNFGEINDAMAKRINGEIGVVDIQEIIDDINGFSLLSRDWNIDKDGDIDITQRKTHFILEEYKERYGGDVGLNDQVFYCKTKGQIQDALLRAGYHFAGREFLNNFIALLHQNSNNGQKK